MVPPTICLRARIDFNLCQFLSELRQLSLNRAKLRHYSILHKLRQTAPRMMAQFVKNSLSSLIVPQPRQSVSSLWRGMVYKAKLRPFFQRMVWYVAGNERYQVELRQTAPHVMARFVLTVE